MKKIISIFILFIGLSSPATFAENSNMTPVQLSYAGNSMLFKNTSDTLVTSTFTAKQTPETPSFFGFLAIAVILGVIGFRMKSTPQ